MLLLPSQEERQRFQRLHGLGERTMREVEACDDELQRSIMRAFRPKPNARDIDALCSSYVALRRKKWKASRGSKAKPLPKATPSLPKPKAKPKRAAVTGMPAKGALVKPGGSKPRGKPGGGKKHVVFADEAEAALVEQTDRNLAAALHTAAAGFLKSPAATGPTAGPTAGNGSNAPQAGQVVRAPALLSRYLAGDTVEVFSRSSKKWVVGIVIEVRDGTGMRTVQYGDGWEKRIRPADLETQLRYACALRELQSTPGVVRIAGLCSTS